MFIFFKSRTRRRLAEVDILMNASMQNLCAEECGLRVKWPGIRRSNSAVAVRNLVGCSMKSRRRQRARDQMHGGG